jgi:hypothetical protein
VIATRMAGVRLAETHAVIDAQRPDSLAGAARFTVA